MGNHSSSSIDIAKMAGTKVTLKLLIDSKKNRVLFAEADNKSVDFLFSIFTLPIGTVTKLLQKQNMAGSLHSLYESIENLSDTYIQAGQDKDFLLNPKVVNNKEAGFVKGLVTYMVMDDLVVKPLSAISGITGVKDVEAVEEKVVDLGLDEVVKLLGASLRSKTVLTDVFLRAGTTGTGLSFSIFND